DCLNPASHAAGLAGHHHHNAKARIYSMTGRLVRCLILAASLSTVSSREASAGHLWGHDQNPVGTSPRRVALRPVYDYLMTPRRDFFLSGYAGNSYPPGRVLAPTIFSQGLTHGRAHAWHGR